MFTLIVPAIPAGKDASPAPLNSQSDVILGYRNILHMCLKTGVSSLTVPVCLMPGGAAAMSTKQVERRAEEVFKCSRGVFSQTARAIKHDTSDGRGRAVAPQHQSITYLLLEGREASFDRVRAMFVEVFRPGY